MNFEEQRDLPYVERWYQFLTFTGEGLGIGIRAFYERDIGAFITPENFKDFIEMLSVKLANEEAQHIDEEADRIASLHDDRVAQGEIDAARDWWEDR